MHHVILVGGNNEVFLNVLQASLEIKPFVINISNTENYHPPKPEIQTINFEYLLKPNVIQKMNMDNIKKDKRHNEPFYRKFRKDKKFY